jgi:hypothetical protein
VVTGAIGPAPGIDTTYDIVLHAAKKHGVKEGFGSRSVERVISEKKMVKKMVDGNEVEEEKEWKYFQLGPYKWISCVSPSPSQPHTSQEEGSYSRSTLIERGAVLLMRARKLIKRSSEWVDRYIEFKEWMERVATGLYDLGMGKRDGGPDCFFNIYSMTR